MNKTTPTSRVQDFINMLKNHRVLSWFIIAGVIIVAIGSVADAINKIWNIFPRDHASEPRIYDFSACLTPCDGTNSITEFPEGTTQIYLAWKYENIPVGAHYVKVWTWEGDEWVKYDCNWRGPESGEDTVPPMTEMGGFRSGRWVMTILLDDEIIFHSPAITVQGDHQYWEPVEDTIYSCYGKMP